MAATHELFNTINLFLSALPATRQGFGIPLHLVAATTNPLATQAVRQYGGISEVQTDLAGGEISAETADALIAAFAQTPGIRTIKVAPVAGDVDYGGAYSAARAADADFYTVTTDNRTDTEIVDVADAVEADGDRIFLAHSARPELLTADLPAGLVTLDGKERTALVYHDVATEPVALAWAAAILTADPDIRSAPWERGLRQIQSYTSSLSIPERAIALANNVNTVLRHGSEPQYLAPGENVRGRPLYEILSGDWLRARLGEALVDLRNEKTGRQEKLLMNASGQALIRARFERFLLQGEAAQHFEQGQTRATSLEITDTDRDLRRVRIDVEAQIAGSAKETTVNIYETADALAAV